MKNEKFNLSRNKVKQELSSQIKHAFSKSLLDHMRYYNLLSK